jgi:RecB family exonuclease
MEENQPERRYMSASSVKMYEECPANWAYQYLEGNRQPSGKYAEIGSAAHAVVESFLKKEIGHPAMHASLVNIPDPNEREQAVQYALTREGKRARLLGTEIEFFIEVLPGVYVKGFIDAAYWHPDGTLEIEDHKTNRQRETAEEWSRKIQPRLYSLIARRFLWPQAQRIRFTIGYVMIGGEVTWETDPEWDDDTMARLTETWAGMGSGTYKETVGEHCRFCPRTAICGAYQDTMMGLASSIVPMLREEHPAERLSRLKGLIKLLEAEEESAKSDLLALVKANGPIQVAGNEWSMGTKSKRVAPEFAELWRAMMGPDGYDSDGVEVLFDMGTKLFTVKLGGLDIMVKEHREVADRVKPLIQRVEEEELTSTPLEKITKKTSKKAPKS